MDSNLRAAKGSLVLWCCAFVLAVVLQPEAVGAQYRPKWPDPILQREIFVLNLEDGYFGCQVNDSADFLQLFELSKLCDAAPQCFKGSDELSIQLKCTDRNQCHPKMPKCVNGVCLDGLCYCNDGFGGKGCDLPDENECKYRPCDVFAHCTNTMGSFYCSCFPGYDGDGFTCHDINECEEPALAALCADNAECCNLPGHFVCKCRPGFTGNATESCSDIDECLDPGCCGRGAVCDNVPGSYSCQCPVGFTGDPSVECWDLDECKENPCGEGAQCTNLPGGYECSCPSGYRGNPSPADGCADVDECSATEKPLCGNGANCVNTPGGYFCQCPPGYTGNPRVACVDIDECPHACGPNTACTNTPGSYSCGCRAGFHGDPYFSAGCSDQNECLSPSACGAKAECYNTVGSYQCICPAGHTGDPLLACVDVDECTQNPCGSGAYCTNLPGSYRCDCPNKYLPRGSADIGCDRAAVDVACARDIDCTSNAGCQESACRCLPGYQAKNADCQDVDECKTRNICGLHAKCYNSEGGYECECKAGYEKVDPSAKSKCRDINECLFGKFPCGENTKCINSDGGYTCVCGEGFIGDPNVGCKSPCAGISCGQHSYCQVHDGNQPACMCDQGFTFDPNNIAAGCVDVNECDGSHGPSGLCGQGALCTNVPGSHHCYCPPGFTGDPFRYCEDIDECSRRYGLYGQCGSGAVCENTMGSYQCSCPAGYTGNARDSCLDVDECSEVYGANGKCGYSAICTNTPGSYSCRCPPGSSGDPSVQCVAEHVCDTDDGCAGNALCKGGKCLCPAPNHGEECKHPCDQLFCGEHAKCELDSNGLPICTCALGYVGKSNSLPGCVDIDECSQRPCGQAAACRNTPGSYECVCPHNFRGDPYSSCEQEGKDEPPVTCSAAHPCPPNEECASNGQSDQCVCRRGYQRDKDNEQCRDVNECIELNSTPCGMNSFCTNLDGGFVCQCPPGYTGNPYTVCYPDVMRCNKNSECPGNTVCTEDAYHGKHCGCDAPYIREGDYCILMSRNCSSNYPCPENHDCIFTGEGYGFCICPKGFTLDANGHCRDINECSEMNDWDLCGHSAQCINAAGSYECVCAPGFTGNGRQGCTRIYNSCEADSQCPNNERCLRSQCECSPPFIKDGLSCKHPCDWQQCGQNAECVLGGNGTQCQCRPGCSGNPNTGCQDINECTSLLPVDPNGPCGASAICVNILGSYKCECSSGSEGDPYTSGCFGPAKCESDAECPVDTACDRSAGSCIDSCSSALCGPNTDCIARDHRATCICKAGYLGDPNELVNGCISPCADVWCAENAQCIVSSLNQGVCRCSEGFFGNPWSGGGCSPDADCSPSRPCPDGQDCAGGMCIDRCNTTKCGVGAKCEPHSLRCECLPFFIGDPDVLCVPPLPMPPICSPGCGSHAHCTYANPNKCVCNSGTSGNPYKACTTVPKCDNIQCGASATCLEGATSVECVCPAGYHGNPYLGCEDINECLQGNPCGTGANCFNVIGSYQCACPPGSVGNPLYACQPPRPGSDREGAQCKLTETCPRGLVCYRGTCTRRDTCTDDSYCSPENACNLVNEEVGYQCVDPCDTLLCGPNSYCLCSEHRASCHCNESFTGNPNEPEFGCTPFTPQPLQCESDESCADNSVCRTNTGSGLRACVDPCENVQCAPNAVCKVSPDRRPECGCSDPNLDGNPYDSQHGCFVPACVKDADCTEDEVCAKISNRKNYSLRECQNVCRGYKCGTNAVCRGDDHKAVCECRANFKGDAYDTRVGCQPAIPTCSDDSSCPDYQACRRRENGLRNCTGVCDNVRCGLNAHCVGRSHQSSCECLPGFIGDAVHGCQKPPQHLCDLDSECANDKACILTEDGIRDCVDTCYGQQCPDGTFCVGREHHAMCECLAGYSRLPADPVGKCAPNNCQNNHDCRDDELCALSRIGILDCVNSCRGVGCGSNAHCTAKAHQAVCECKTGFEGNPDDLNRGCKPRDQCTTDNDCISSEVCRLSPAGIRVCLDGCADDHCGSNAICSVSNHFVICACKDGFSGQPENRAIGCQEVQKGKVCTQPGSCVVVDKDTGADKDEPRCTVDSACNPSEICEGGNCILGCRRDSDCTFDKACFNSKCVNPCTVATPCGANADCQPVVHRPRCTCLVKYAGNPYDFCDRIAEVPPPECSKDENCGLGQICEHEKCLDGCRYDENCPHDKACINRQCLAPCSFPEACGEDAQCTAVTHRPRCSCGAGATGDPNIKCIPIITPGCIHDADCGSGSICESGKCIDACRTDDTCPYTTACINRRCQDPCSVFGACGRNALCRPENHRPVCSCPAEFRGDAAVVCDRQEQEQLEVCTKDSLCQFGYICESGACLEGCRNDDQCTQDKTCYNRVCKDPCSFQSSCGANTNCAPNSHRPVCTCKTGFVGDPHVECRPLRDVRECEGDGDCGPRLICDSDTCVIGCRNNRGCSYEESCINRLCQNPCGFFGVCGRNAECSPQNHTASCQCPGGFRGNPNTVCTEAPPQCLKDNECVLGQICENAQCIVGCRHDNNCPEQDACINGQCQNPCSLSNACGANAKCTPYTHRPRCECNENHLGNPYVKCEPIPDDYCEVDSACPLGRICDNNRCLEGCRNDIHCKFEQACINKVCQNPCNIYGACGIGAACKPANHDRVCTCQADFTGDPRSLCERIKPPPECTLDNQCPLGQICSNDRCIYGCHSSANCPAEKACVKSRCINACAVSGACGRGATCTPSDHVAVCNCPSGFRGDPDVECKEIPPECRQDDDCGLERICLKQKCIVGCRTHSNCPYDKACVNGFCQSPCDIGGMCGVNTICRSERHEAHCTCSPGYTGDPLRQCSKIFVECEADSDCGGGYVCAHNQCKDINECLKETLPCGPGASCQNLPGWYKCSCPVPLVGNAYGAEGCRPAIPVCFHDSDCPNDQKCNPTSQECYDICSKAGTCGRGAICKAVDSKALCECQPGHRGNPYVECSICDSCARHLDCPGNLLCLGEFCGCPHPYIQQQSFCVLPSANCSTSLPCPLDQRCVYGNKTIRDGFCSCPKGYLMSSDGRCSDVNECEEKPFPCGHGAKCRNNDGAYECECPYGSYGNPYESGCVPEGPRKECFHDSDCPDERACLEYTCKDPCVDDHSCGQHAICSATGHKKECKCKEGYIGNPYEACGPFVECVTDSNCPGNLICLHDHSCGCPSDFKRTYDYCIKQSSNCTTNNPCPGNEECLYTNNDYGLCICPRGFRLTPEHTCEDINECLENVCAPHAQCYNLPGTYECICSEGFEGDPYRTGCQELRREPPGCISDHECPSAKKCDLTNGQCYDPCTAKGELEFKCGNNAICKTEDHESSCYCPPGFEGYPNKVCLPIVECGVTYNCPGNLICLDSHTCGCPPTFFRENDYCFIRTQNCTTTDPCAVNEECVYTGDKSGFCVCPHGYELLPYGECRAIKLCEENNPCAPGAVCKDKPGSYECLCPVDTIGDPYVKGCQPIVGCTTDHDCPFDRECDTSKQCISPCHVCGPNAECTVRDHQAICVCTHGKVGEPYNKQIGCFTPPPPDTPPEVRTIPPIQDLQVMCLADGVQVGVQLGGYDGIVYVKGHSNDAACRRLVSSNEIDTIDFKVQFGQCGLIHVNGEASFILVVQKHPRLVTYRARAYHIKCVYSTGERTVTLGFNVSMITTSGTIANTGPPPTCLMSICTLEGREISSAEIGDDLLLKVDVQPDFIYGGFARSCVAKTMEDDGEFQYEVTDANGCATDPSIFGNWEYDPHQKTLMARFNAFKFPSSNNLRFQCNIRVCFGSCPPVNCEGVDAYGRRRRRQVRDEDLVLTDSFKEGALREEIMVQSNAILTFEKRDPQPSQPIEGPRIEDIDHVCLPKLGLILSMIITTLLALVAVAVAISCWLMAYRRRPKRLGPLPHPPDFPNPLYTTPEPVAEPSPDYYQTSHHGM